MHQPMTLIDLPELALVNIMKFLPFTYIRAVRLTCKKLYQISQSIEIIERQKFTTQFFDANDDIKFDWIIDQNMAPLNIEVNISQLYRNRKPIFIESNLWNLISLIGPNISSLLIDHNTLCFSAIEKILVTCNNLKELCLINIIFEKPTFSIIKPGITNIKFKNLIINYCAFNSFRQVTILLKFFPNLRKLAMQIFINLANDDSTRFYVRFNNYVIPRLFRYNKSIQEINLALYNSFNFGRVPIRPGLDVHLRDCTNTLKYKLITSSKLELRSLQLQHLSVFSEADVRAVFSKYTDIEELCLGFDGMFTEKYLQSALPFCKNLRRLIFRQYTMVLGGGIIFPQDLKIISELISQVGIYLRDLELDLVHILGNHTEGLNFPHLEVFKIRFKVSNENVRNKRNCLQFLQNCRLKYLILMNCNIYETDIIRAISASQDSLISLKVMADHLYVEPNTTSNLSLHFPKLEELFFHTPKSLADAILQRFNFPSLRSFYFKSYPKERDDAVLILKIRSRIEELEKKFLSSRAAQRCRQDKWRIILSDPSPYYSNNIELSQSRNSVSQIPQDLFINTVCSLYSEMSNAAAHQVRFQVQYDDASIRMALRDAGMTPDDSKVRVVSSLISPILLP